MAMITEKELDVLRDGISSEMSEYRFSHTAEVEKMVTRLSELYAPKKVIELLNGVKNELVCVRGNCDTEVDQMVLEFPILADYMLIFEKGKSFFVTHGHHHNTTTPPMLKEGDILIHGHTHVLTVTPFGNSNTYINPGSVTLPKEGNPKSYMTYEDGVFEIKDFDGNVIKSYEI